MSVSGNKNNRSKRDVKKNNDRKEQGGDKSYSERVRVK